MSIKVPLVVLSLVVVLSHIYSQSTAKVDSLELNVLYERDPERKSDMLIELAEELQVRDPDAALIHANRALDISLAANLVSGELKSMNLLAEIYFEKTELKIAMDYAMKARLLADESDDPAQLARSLYTMGIINTYLGNYEKSSDLLYMCLKISEQNGNRVFEVKALNSIGVVYHNQNNYEKAFEYYSRALSMAQDIKYNNGIAKGLNNVAAIYGTWGKYDLVTQYIRDAIQLNQETGNRDLLGVNFLNLGYYFQETEEYDSAYHYYSRALDMYEELNNPSSIISTKVFFSEYYLATGDLISAKKIATETLKEARLNGLKRFEFEASTILRKLFFLEQDSIQAYKFQVIELMLKDSLSIEESKTRLAMLELQYRLEKNEQSRKASQQRKDLIIVIVGISLLFTVVFVILLLGRMRIKARSVLLEKEKLEMNLDLRNRELTANVMSIMKKNESLSQIAGKLKVIQQEAVKDETREAIRKMTAALNKAVEEEQWDEFEVRFKQVHSEFYDKLIQQYPNLSPQEQRLCAFLRLNMTSKEISEITGQRISTIEMARTRLRKKLGITNTQTNLISFLARL